MCIRDRSQGVESDLDSGDDESIHNASLEEADELFKQQSKTCLLYTSYNSDRFNNNSYFWKGQINYECI